MLNMQQVMMSQMYVEERLEQAAHDRMLREVDRARRAQRGNVALRVRVGRILVRVGQRLESPATYRDVEMGLR